MATPNLTGFDPYSNTGKSSDGNLSSKQPSKSSTLPSSVLRSSLNNGQIQFFSNQGYTLGLLQTLLKEKKAYAQRCWILDNGSKMLVKDSHKISFDQATGGIINLGGISRWDELMDCIGNQVWITSNIRMSMRFALLNRPSEATPQYFTLDKSNTNQQQEIQKVREIMTSVQPGGPTNLTKQLHVIQKYVASIAYQLRSTNQKVSVVIATQGLPTNDSGECNAQVTEEFIAALKSFQTFPVHMTMRLCTDDEVVFNFYNHIVDRLTDNLDHGNLISYDVVDDYFGESLEVYLKNPWLTYGLALHRVRELGLYVHELDTLDERLLTLDELYRFCFILFSIEGKVNSTLPDPKVNWEGFLNAVSSLMMNERQQWNPVTKKFCPWINIHQLRRSYGTKPTQSQMYTNTSSPNPFQQQQRTQTHPPQKDAFNQQTNHPQPPPQTPPSFQAKPPVPVQTNLPPTDNESVKKNLLTSWALQAPAYQSLKQLPELLGSLQFALPPAFGIEEHAYFQKWKVLSHETMLTGGKAVVKRAHRKAKFLLHPDKLPRDLTEKQTHVCKLIWDILADAWEAFEKD